ncbi:MAG: SDR family oxidoreductase [Bacteroidales bacterium]|nr:SDR family oxidoreductase [Bacteroidales bacterium]MBR6933152.1 SDR family oxidoreductase [Bacteroidales bacterium]
MFNLKGHTALVTGSGQGIGRATAILLAKQGAKVIVNWNSNDVKAAVTMGAIRDAGGECIPWKYNISSATVRQDFEKFMADNGLEVDILVLNASVQIRNEWEQITPEEFDTQMHTNFRASLLLIQACVPGMRKKGWGRIVTVGSVQQSRPNTAMAVYAATKAAQNNLCMTLCGQLAGDGITINNIAPGAIETVRNEKVLADPAYRKMIEDSIPVGFVGQSDDIAPTILLLCSDEGRYLTGADIPIDGGMSIPFTKGK